MNNDTIILPETEIKETEATEKPEKPQTFNQFKLPAFLKEGLRVMNFASPTKIQAQAIPVLLSGKDLVAQSQTGSGKTAAFAIPLLASVDRYSRDLQALVMVPTRELAIQVTNVFRSLAGNAVRVTPIYGGASLEGQSRGLMRGGYQIVIGTPGRLRDHLNRGTLRLNKLRFAVLDEADEMLDRGFAQDVEEILQAASPVASRQTALFSATLPDWVMQTARQHLRQDYSSITLDVSAQSQPDIEQIVYDMKLGDKHDALRQMLNTYHNSPILVFARTKRGVKKLADRLETEGYSVAGLQGNLSQRAREEVVTAFRANKIRVMVATNVGARGLDVSGISHVINFDLPESAELFTHRVGRTGRNGASGTAVTFLTGEDMVKWREIERFITAKGVTFERKRWRMIPGAGVAPVIVPSVIAAGLEGQAEKPKLRYYDQEGSERSERSERRSYSGSGERSPRWDRGERSERRPYSGSGERDSRGPKFGGFGDSRRPRRENSTERSDVMITREGDSSFGRRPRRDSAPRFEDNRSRGESRRFEDRDSRPRRDSGDSFDEKRAPRGESRRFEDRDSRPRGESRRFEDRDSRPNREFAPRFEDRDSRPRSESRRFEDRDSRSRRDSAPQRRSRPGNRFER